MLKLAIMLPYFYSDSLDIYYADYLDRVNCTLRYQRSGDGCIWSVTTLLVTSLRRSAQLHSDSQTRLCG
jgi:hypothetical protein